MTTKLIVGMSVPFVFGLALLAVHLVENKAQTKHAQEAQSTQTKAVAPCAPNVSEQMKVEPKKVMAETHIETVDEKPKVSQSYPHCPDDMRAVWPSRRELAKKSKACNFDNLFTEDADACSNFEYTQVYCIPDNGN